MSTPEKTYIYELWDPRNDEVRYVGKSDNPRTRLARHLAISLHDTSPLSAWIRELRQLGLKPKLHIASEVPYSQWQDAERSLIREYREAGCNLLNRHKGGGGGPDWDDEKRAFYRDMTKLLWQNPGFREKVTAAIQESHSRLEFVELCRENTLGLWTNPEYRERVLEGIAQAWNSVERRKALSENVRRMLQDEDYVARWYSSVIKAWNNDVRRQALSERNYELWNDPDHRQKWEEGIRKGHQSDSCREKCRQNMKARWDDPAERARLAQIHKEVQSRPESKQRLIDQNKRLWSDPEHRAKRCEAMSQSWTPERKAAQAERIRQRNKQK